MPYLTPDSLPSDVICRTVLIPNHIDWLVIVNGALSELINASKFEQFGSLTPEEVANRFEQMFFEFRDSECATVTPIGGIMMFGGDTPPDKWLLCDGQAVSRDDYADLFAVIGIEYGAGNETTTFNVPNFTDRSPMGTGGDFTGFPGVEAGAHEHTLSVDQLPAHNHAVNDPGHTHVLQSPFTSIIGARPSGGAAASAGTSLSGGAQLTTNTTGITTANTGGGLPHPNVHPVLGVTFLIYAGVTP